MDVVQLLNLAYHGNKEERTQSTAALEEAFRSPSGPQHLLSLLEAGLDISAPAERSLSALIYCKNALLHILNDDVIAGTPGFLPALEQRLFAGAFQVPASHRKIIRSCAATLISGFQWNYLEELMPMVGRNLDTTSAEQSVAVLEMLYAYMKRFKTMNLEPMALKLQVCEALLPVISGYMNYRDFRVYHILFKIIECVVETGLQLNSCKSEIPLGAMDELFQTMLRFPEQCYQPATAAGGQTYTLYVRCMKRIAMITYSVLNDATRRKKPAPVAKHFLKAPASAFFVMWRQWLGMCVAAEDRETHRKSAMFALRYIKLSSLDEQMYLTLLQPEAMQLVEQIMFPFLCYGDDDDAVFADDEDLAEYVQYMNEEAFITAELSLRQAASNTILSMLSGKKKFQDPAPLLQSLLGVLTAGFESSLGAPASSGSARQLFGFLHLLSILRKQIRDVSEIWTGQMALVLMRFVAPCVQPTTSLVALRCKAIVVCQRYSKVPMASEEDFASFMAMMCGLVNDKDPRVRLAGIDAMCTLLEMKRARPYLTPVLVPLVEECLLFLNKVQTTFVPTVILHLTTYFAPELTPVMGKLGHALVKHFQATVFDMEQQENAPAGDGEDFDLGQYDQAAFSADALLDAIFTVVTSCGEHEEAFLSMRPEVLQMIRQVFEHPDNFDFLDKTLSILLHVVYFSKPIPQECWDLLPLLFKLVEDGIGVDYFSSIEEVLDNFVAGATVAYFTNSAVMEATFKVCEKMLVGGVVCMTACQTAPSQLIEAMLHTASANQEHPGLFDPYLPRFAALLLQSLLHPDIQQADVQVRIWIIAALMDCFSYNAAATFQVFVQSNAYPSFFDGMLYFFRGCVEDCTPAGAAPTSQKKSRRGKKKEKIDEASAVPEQLSILTRKVISMGLTSLLKYMLDPTKCGASALPQAASFAAQYEAPVLSLIQYCLFCNRDLYVARCRISEANLEKIRLGIEDDVEDVDPTDEVILGVDGADDTIADYGDLSDDDLEEVEAAGMGEEAGLELDEGDDYESPIDDINEVEFFLAWLQWMPQQPAEVQKPIRDVLYAAEKYTEAAQTAGRYRQLCKELEAAMRDDFQARQGTASA